MVARARDYRRFRQSSETAVAPERPWRYGWQVRSAAVIGGHAAPTTSSAATSPRSASTRCSPRPRRSTSPSRSRPARWPSERLADEDRHAAVARRAATRRPRGRRRPSSGSSSRTSASSCRSPSATSPPGCRCSTSSRRATSGSSGRSRSSTTARASSSPPTPRGGSARPSAAASPTRAAPSACRRTSSTRWPCCRRRRARCSRSSGREPTAAELARAHRHGRSTGSRRRCSATADVISLSAGVGEDATEFGDLLADENAEVAVRRGRAPASRRSRSATLLHTSTDREREVLELRFGLVGERPLTLDEVGRQFESPASASARSRPRRSPSCATPARPGTRGQQLAV